MGSPFGCRRDGFYINTEPQPEGGSRLLLDVKISRSDRIASAKCFISVS